MRKWLLSFLIVFIAQLILMELYSYSDTFQTEKKQQAIQHEVAVTLKLIQVYVTDKKGNFVLDLKKDDFTIQDNGKKQLITEFEKHILSLPFAKAEIQPEIIQETKIPPPRELLNRKFFLLFDFAYNNAKGILKAKQAALHFIDTQLTRSDEIGVISYSTLKSLVLHEYLTTDHRIVRKVVESFGMKDSLGRAENLEEQYWREITGENPRDASKSGGVFHKEKEILPRRREERIEQILEKIKNSHMTPEEAKRLLEQVSPEVERFEALGDTRHYALIFCQKIKELAKALRYIPGYKYIILFSSGIPYSLAYGIQAPFGDISFEGSWGDSLLRQRYEGMLKELAASNSILYTLDTEDLATKIASDMRMTGAFSLKKMANTTGGKYFGNINNYEEHLEKIQTLTGCYYILGYYIDEKWNGKYHKIRVNVLRPGCEVHAQRGYFNPKPFSEYSELEKMLHLVDLALSEEPLFQIPLRFPMRALPCSIKRKTNLVQFSCIPMEKIKEIAGKEAELVSIIFDKEDNIVKIQREIINFSQLPRSNIYYSTLLALNPGDYKCRLVIRNLETGRGAVASSSVTIPGNPGSGIKLDSPLLLKPEKDAFYLNKPSPIYSFNTAQYSPVIDDLEQGIKSLHAIVRCSFFGIEKPEIKLSANLIHQLADTRKAIPVSISVLDKYQEDDTEIYLIEIQTGELTSGEYFLYLFAEDKHNQSRSRVNATFKLK
jgi:VWFA-related protein